MLRMQTFPARGNNAVEILLNDHTTIKELLNELTSAEQMQHRKAVLEQLKGILTVHNATEENLVYPALDVVAKDRKESKHLYEETADADVLLFKLDTLLKTKHGEEFEALAREFQEALLDHIDDEETSAFPNLQDKAEPEQERMLTKSVREFRDRFVVQEDNVQS
jgi:hemerythrin superfamily protein